MGKSQIYTLNHSGVGPRYEEDRLNFQHNVFLRMTHGNLVPTQVTAALPIYPRIADVATGTGIWLNELSKQLPRAQLEGFDLAPDNFRATASNVKLHEYSQDVLEPFHEDLIGKFDLVHVRLLIFGLKADEWTKAFKNVSTLLKPGGWVHWEETGYISWVTIPPSQAWYNLLAYDMEFAVRSGRDITHPARLLQHAIDAGFVECAEHDYCGFGLDNGHDEEVDEIMARIATQACFGIVAKGGMEGLKTNDDAKKMVAAMREELLVPDRHASLDMKWVWGKKPSELPKPPSNIEI